MGSIRFGQSQANISPAVLNHQTASPLKANNIQIRIGSDYLKDFTPSGIESFVDKHTKFFESGDKKLDATQVKAFIQKLAQNPESVKNMTFDLKDPELGLLRNDGIEERHIKGAFQVDFEDTSQLAKGSATDVKFVDAKSVTFDLKTSEDTIAGAQKQITTLRDEKKGLQGELADAKDELALARRVIGEGSQDKYAQLNARQGEITESLSQLDQKETDYKAELEAEDTTPERKAELRHVLAGIGEERKTLKAEQAQHAETLDKTHGPLLQRYALKDLPALEAKVKAKEQAIGEVDEKIKAQVKVVEGAVSPVAEGAKMPDKPAETEAAAKETPEASEADEVKPADKAGEKVAAADADTEVPEETIQVGPKPELAALKEKPAKHQAQSLKDMSTADQKAFIGSLSAEEKAALKTEVEGFIASTENTTGARFRTANTKYKELLAVVNGTSTTTSAASSTTTTATKTESKTTTTTADTPSNVTVGEAGEAVPDEGLTRKSQPLKVNGEVVTKSSFKSLSVQDKFDILMKADKEFLRDLLTSMSKEERSEIRTLARARLAKYAGSYSSNTSSSTVHIQRNDDGTASYVTTNASGQQTVRAVSKEHQEEVERAQYILDIIAELDGPDTSRASNSTTTTTTTDSSTTTTVNRNNQSTQVDTSASTEGLQTVKYRVTPGETASDIANRQYGNRLRGQEILRLNPELEASVKRRANGDEREYTRVPLVEDPKKELTITILHKDEKPLEDPVSHARPAPAVQQRPKVTEEKPVAKPVEKPAEKPVTPAPAAVERPKVTEEKPEDKPAPPPRATS